MPAFEVAPEPIPDSSIKETIDCDVAIVGAGISGTPAAMKAAEMGAKVRVLEKGPTYGLHRTGGFAAFGTKAQKAAGIELSQELAEEILANLWGSTMAFQGRLPLSALWVRHSAEAADWIAGILAAKGVTVRAMTAGGITGAGGLQASVVNPNRFWDQYYLIHRMGKTFEEGENVDWMAPMVEYAMEQGAAYHYNTTARQLVRDDSGRVNGVIAQNEHGDYLRFLAKKGVILAAGDFINDEEMVSVFCPHLAKNVNNFSNKYCTGDGHKMAIWVGADMDQIVAGDIFPGQSITGKNLHPDEPFWALYMDWWWCPAVASMPMLYVDIAGYRYANENLPFQQNAVAAIGMPQGYVWSLWDSAWQTKFPMIPEKTPASRNTPEQIEIDLREGITMKADTIEALAGRIAVPINNLRATIARYNELCAKGHDDDCLKEAIWMRPIDTPPFYAAGIGAAITGTRGGVKINADMQVLDKKGLVIPGLYAVGNNAGSFYGMVYPPQIEGSGIGHAFTFAYLAAKHVAASV
ncbi:MAG: FAD-dependent oxidoreductase [Actinobacteria bacterium]|nr:FAD-dependent oxidoreductase [Actinomycetota bacterium]